MPLNFETNLLPSGLATAYGITAQYFKIGQMYVDYETNTGFVKYLGYESQAKAFSGNTPIKTIEMRLGAADVTGIYGQAVTNAKLTVTGSSVITYFDGLIKSADKATILQDKTTIVYPASEYT